MVSSEGLEPPLFFLRREMPFQFGDEDIINLVTVMGFTPTILLLILVISLCVLVHLPAQLNQDFHNSPAQLAGESSISSTLQWVGEDEFDIIKKGN